MQAIKQKFRKATSTSKGKVIVSSIFFVIILAITGGIVYWQTHKKMIIREKLESAIEEKSGGFYKIKYETLELDEITGYLSITNLTLAYDSLQFAGLKQMDMIPPTLLKIHIPEITVEGVKTPRALIDKEITGRKLEIKNPDIEIIYTMQGKDSARNSPTKEVYEQILGNLNEISMDTVLISGANIRTNTLKNKDQGMVFTNATIQLLDVKVDSAANEDPSRLLFSKQVAVGFGELSWLSANKLYKYGVRDVSVNSLDSTMHVRNFIMAPQLGEDAFVKSLPAQDDRFDFSLNDITINDIDINQLFNEEIMAESMEVRSASFKIYRDLNIPRDKKNRVGKYPHQSISQIPIPVLVKKMVISSAFLEYKERNNITKNAGKVQFHNIYATISNFTNKKEALEKNNIMNVNVTSSFLNKSPFKVSWVFYLGHPNGRFNVKGSMAGIDAKDLNPLVEPMGPARIEDGTINGVDFNLSGNDYSMNGTIKLLYDDLKVALLEKDKNSKEWDKKSLTSFVANLLIKNSNPKNKDDEPRVISVTNERDTNRSIFYLAWKTLFKGIKETVGVKK